MKTENIIHEIKTLPLEIQQQVFDFVAFLKNRHLPSQSLFKVNQIKKQIKLLDEPFIGMWQNREDIQDSTQWVRKLRQQEWK